ncbi:protein NEN4-like isoform X2 [Olea europaea var. sylvestris]|uniref:protein NEN4-like isoform X2 n=1 Tax=Olea europaea var. sylvestris TaxID=158386 RepID=UPI000C1CFAB0|nr:protein NEN4-like isoform X2 [Olea europaea var. sylvestris]
MTEMASSNSSLYNERVAEIVFFDLETTVPNRTGQKFRVLEFGAIIVCPQKLVELESYCTLIRPRDLSAVASRSARCDGITRDAVTNAPYFEEVSDKIFSILNGRIWAGHNIQRFDCVRIREAFAEIGRPAPVPVGIIDSLGVLTEKFGRRAGNMKESSLPSALNTEWHSSLGVTTRSKSLQQSSLQWNKSSEISGRFSQGKSICREETSRKSPPSSSISCKRTVP